MHRCLHLMLLLGALTVTSVGCATSRTFDQPYDRVVRAIGSQFGDRDTYSVSREQVEAGRHDRFHIAPGRQEAGVMRSSGETDMDVELLKDGRVKVSAHVVRDNYVTVDRDPRREEEILSELEQFLAEQPPAIQRRPPGSDPRGMNNDYRPQGR